MRMVDCAQRKVDAPRVHDVRRPLSLLARLYDPFVVQH